MYEQIDVTGWRNQTVDLTFVATLNGSLISNFFLDDVGFWGDTAPGGTLRLSGPTPAVFDAAAPRDTH